MVTHAIMSTREGRARAIDAVGKKLRELNSMQLGSKDLNHVLVVAGAGRLTRDAQVLGADRITISRLWEAAALSSIRNRPGDTVGAYRLVIEAKRLGLEVRSPPQYILKQHHLDDIKPDSKAAKFLRKVLLVELADMKRD